MQLAWNAAALRSPVLIARPAAMQPSCCTRVLFHGLLRTLFTIVLQLYPQAQFAMLQGTCIINGAPLAAHAFTALPIAAARAVAHERSGQVVADPLARKLLLGVGGKQGEQLLNSGANVEYMSLRKTLGDELVHSMYASQFAVRQVVSLGAGLDSRAFRLGLADTRFFEVDSQELFDMKVLLVLRRAPQHQPPLTVVGLLSRPCRRNHSWRTSRSGRRTAPGT